MDHKNDVEKGIDNRVEIEQQVTQRRLISNNHKIKEMEL